MDRGSYLSIGVTVTFLALMILLVACTGRMSASDYARECGYIYRTSFSTNEVLQRLEELRPPIEVEHWHALNLDRLRAIQDRDVVEEMASGLVMEVLASRFSMRTLEELINRGCMARGANGR